MSGAEGIAAIWENASNRVIINPRKPFPESTFFQAIKQRRATAGERWPGENKSMLTLPTRLPASIRLVQARAEQKIPAAARSIENAAARKERERPLPERSPSQRDALIGRSDCFLACRDFVKRVAREILGSRVCRIFSGWEPMSVDWPRPAKLISWNRLEQGDCPARSPQFASAVSPRN